MVLRGFDGKKSRTYTSVFCARTISSLVGDSIEKMAPGVNHAHFDARWNRLDTMNSPCKKKKKNSSTYWYDNLCVSGQNPKLAV